MSSIQAWMELIGNGMIIAELLIGISQDQFMTLV
jgi:hypothetical protein